LRFYRERESHKRSGRVQLGDAVSVMLAWLFPSPHLKNDISDIEKATAPIQ
jgi:hypothetical protein